MHVSITGISHHATPISLRERLAFSREELVPALAHLNGIDGAAAILSTCNRTELYLTGSAADSDSAVASLSLARGEPIPEGVGFYHFVDGEAVRHLYRVAAGVDSLVVGESEILGQVREAFAASTAANVSDPVLARLFHTAMRVGRRARTDTEIGAHGLSVSAIAVALSRGALGSLRGKTVLVVGAGEAGQRAAGALVQSGAGRLLVTTRTAGRAEEIASELNGLALPFDDLASALVEADVVISATAAPATVIDYEMLDGAMAKRRQRPIVIVDIAVPRDVDSEARRIPGVHLYDIDDLQAVAEHNLSAREGEVGSVEAIVEAEAQRFDAWLSGRQVQPTIAALRRTVEATRRAEVERTLSRMDLEPGDRERIEAMTKALVKRILHTPTARLRDGTSRHLDIVRDLFDLDDVTR